MNTSRIKNIVAVFGLAALAACSTTGTASYYGGGPYASVTHSTEASTAVNTKAEQPKREPRTIEVRSKNFVRFASPRPRASKSMIR